MVAAAALVLAALAVFFVLRRRVQKPRRPNDAQKHDVALAGDTTSSAGSQLQRPLVEVLA